MTLSLYEGFLLYELRRKDEAKAAVRSAFLLRPQAALPVPVSPKIQADVDAFAGRPWPNSRPCPRLPPSPRT